MKNLRIRKELLDQSMTQRELAVMLKLSPSALNVILTKYELAKSEQDEIIRVIREQNVEPA